MVIPQTGRYMQRPYSHHAMQLTPSHFAGRRLATATVGAALTPVTEISQKSKGPGLTHTNARRGGDSPLSRHLRPISPLYAKSGDPCIESPLWDCMVSTNYYAFLASLRLCIAKATGVAT